VLPAGSYLLPRFHGFHSASSKTMDLLFEHVSPLQNMVVIFSGEGHMGTLPATDTFNSS
jgi:hypothetical protein